MADATKEAVPVPLPAVVQTVTSNRLSRGFPVLDNPTYCHRAAYQKDGLDLARGVPAIPGSLFD